MESEDQFDSDLERSLEDLDEEFENSESGSEGEDGSDN